MLVRERRAVKLVSVVDVYSWLVMFWLWSVVVLKQVDVLLLGLSRLFLHSTDLALFNPLTPTVATWVQL